MLHDLKFCICKLFAHSVAVLSALCDSKIYRKVLHKKIRKGHKENLIDKMAVGRIWMEKTGRRLLDL